jgi:hypothetical protein
MYNNRSMLLELENVRANQDKITITNNYVYPAYFDRIEDEGRIWNGDRGWIGPGQGTPPIKAMFHKLSINVPISKVDSITKILEGINFTHANHFTREYKDNGAIFNFAINYSCKIVKHKAVIVKKPWFDELLAFMKERDSTYDEEQLMNIKSDEYGSYTYNDNAISEYKPAYTESVRIADEEIKTLNISIMNTDVPANTQILNSFIGMLFLFIE